MMQLRPYQSEAVTAIRREWAEGKQRTLLVLPTGGGKTVVMSKVAEGAVREGGRVLIMAHRGELLTQAADKLRMVTGLESAIEKAESSSLGSMFPVTVGSVQSLCRERRLSRFPRDYFSTILVDEAHHCLADSYQHVLAHFPDANVLGVTATPDKLLKKQMGQYFDSLAYEYTMRQAIKDGYLCPIKAQMIPLGLDISGVGVSEGDYRADDLGSALEPYLEQIADEMLEYCRGRKTVVFLPLVSTSRKFCAMLRDRGFRAAEVNGESPDLNDEAAEIYGQRRVAVALAGTSSDGDRQGIVLVSVERETISELTSGALKIFMLTALAVFAVALLATPFLTNRETKPIQDMAAAARQIAHGNLNVRVSTNCQTEEMEELAVAFNNMAAAMQNADTARQEFVANVSHELKTPMTTIAGYLDGMLDGTIPQPEQRHYMELVSTEVRRLSRLVRNMLEISRLKDQGIPADKLADFDLCEAAGQALLSFEQRINRKHLNVDVDMPELGVTVRAMPDAVTQVLYNLIDNAVKFIDDGGTLSIRVERSGNKAVTTVGNTGPTIAPEELPLIFDRFHKTDKSRSTDRDGVGLGLYIVKTIVLAHGEDIYVTSRDGKTEFTFTLPLVL